MWIHSKDGASWQIWIRATRVGVWQEEGRSGGNGGKTDNFHSISLHLLRSSPHPVLHSPWWFLSETVTWYYLYCMFKYFYCLLIEKEIWDCQNVSVKLPCVYVCLSPEDLFILFSRCLLFLFLFLYWREWQTVFIYMESKWFNSQILWFMYNDVQLLFNDS